MNRLSRFIIASSFVVVVTVSLLFITFTKGVEFASLSDSIHLVTRPIETFLSKPVILLSEQKDRLMDLFSAYEENKQLKKILFDLEKQVNESDTLRKENEGLRHSLGITEQHQDKILVPGFITVRTPDAWVRQVSINLGQEDGISKGMLVLANGGVIGVVNDSDFNSATVKLLSNSDEFTKIPIKIVIENQDIYGILSGYDTETNSFIVNQLNSTLAIPIGTNVVTSDLAGATPANLQIGRVRSIKDSSSDFNRELFIEPTANFSNLYSVLVVRN